ncbi:hypothetical protein MSAN_01502400 [Mycena sanguinolenta]|uniref:Protein kinase domain-containing protein n=1 Tax=Mycena sanguinolenta TaxID=230812 RepID=A0A8H6Y799_9AGAR|nr:hypothetical protein MSAN_01502400 [Mycena sanguinolenta]
MDLHADSEPEVTAVSTSDAKSAVYPSIVSPEASRRASNANPFIQSFSLLPSLLRGRFKTSGTSEARTRKYSETKPGRHAAEQPVNNYYNYHITGGFGGSGGEGHNQGGNGGVGHGPTIYFGQPRDRESSDFRTIRRGDLKLVKEVRLSTESGVVAGMGVQRTVYHAAIRGDPVTVTVAVYQGDGAGEEWQRDIAKYESIWHPNIMQLYGLVSTRGLHAMIFHDELIPYDQFFGRFQHLPILSTYIIGYCTTEFLEANAYVYNVIGSSKENSVWIRPSTGQLCLDLIQGGAEASSKLYWWPANVLRLENVSLDAPDSEDIIISSLSEDQYHKLCSQPSMAQHQCFQVSTECPVGPGIFRLDSQCGTCVRITEPFQILPEEELRWNNAPDELLPNSWIRYDFPRMFALWLELNLSFPLYEIRKAWLAQANHIFAELQELEHVEGYVFIDEVRFILRITDKHDIPKGHLFVCPPQDFRTSTEPHANSYKWPAYPVYWSLDPSGADRLNTEDANNLGFPAIHIETVMRGASWDHSVYQGLRQFHEGKGCDPDSQEVARRLEYPLFEVLSDRVPFPARKVKPYSWCELDPELCQELGHYL